MPKNKREDEELAIGADARAILRKPEAFHLREKRIRLLRWCQELLPDNLQVPVGEAASE